MSRAHGPPFNFFKSVPLTFVFIILKCEVVMAKPMPIANVNRIVFVN